MASSSGRVSRKSSEKMSSSIVVPGALVVALGLDAQQLLLVVPLVERLGLVEALVALEADEAARRSSRPPTWPAGSCPCRRAPRPGSASAAGRRGRRCRRCPRRPGSRPCAGHRGPRARTRSGSRPSASLPAALDRPVNRFSARPSGGSSRLAGAADDVLGGGELPQPHGAAGVELLGADADLGAEAELLAVDEPGRGVDQDGGGVDLAGEAVGGGQVGGDDGLAVTGAVPGDVVDGLVDRRPPPRPPASGRGTPGPSPPRWPVPAPGSRSPQSPWPVRRPPAPPRRAALGERRWRNASATVPVDQQRLGRVAHRRSLRLGVDDDAPGHVQVGGGVDVDVAVAVAVDDVGNGGVLEDRPR